MRVQFKKNWIESTLHKWKETEEVAPKFSFFEQICKTLNVKQKWEVLTSQASNASGERMLDEWFMRNVAIKEPEQICDVTEVTEHLSQPEGFIIQEGQGCQGVQGMSEREELAVGRRIKNGRLSILTEDRKTPNVAMPVSVAPLPEQLEVPDRFKHVFERRQKKDPLKSPMHVKSPLEIKPISRTVRIKSEK